MPEKLPENMREALEADKRALEMKVATTEDPEMVAGYKARIDQVNEQLGEKKAKRAAKGKETRPAKAAETREG
jgi:hypothetical protein